MCFAGLGTFMEAGLKKDPLINTRPIHSEFRTFRKTLMAYEAMISRSRLSIEDGMLGALSTVG